MRNKRGREESATSAAATVIIIIGLLIVLYLILIPEDVREDVLEGKGLDEDTDDNGENGDTVNERDKVLLLKHPGLLLPSGKEDVEEEIASMNLFDISDLQNKKIADRVFVYRSFFSNDFKDIEFSLDDLDNIEELDLFMNIISSKGNIRISLNGRIFFEGSLDSSNVPIGLPMSSLRERNILRLEGRPVGFAFLTKNEFELGDLELIQKVKSENKQESRTFNVDRAESVDNPSLKFFVNCLEIDRDQGFLTVYLNRRVVFFTKVVCDASQINLDLDEDIFVDGANILNFQIDKGEYIIERIELEYRFDEGFHPLYFFTIDETDFEDIVDNDDKVKLIMRFKEDNERKRADVRLNDETIFVDTNTGRFEKDITELTREGENFIKIFAKEEFELVELEIKIEREE